jgi:hypothetical protein
MKRLIALLVLAAVALIPASANAKSRAKVYRGTFQLVGADGDYSTGNFGHAQLVDGRRHDKLSVHVRRLGSHKKYVFRLQQAPKACAADAPGGTNVPKWHYRHHGALRTNRKGVANGSAWSHRFRAQQGVEYFVGVYPLVDGKPGDLILCAELKRKGKAHGKADDKGKAHGKSKHKAKGKHKHKGEAEGKHKAKAKGKAKTENKGDAPGQSEESHGQSDEAHGKSDEPHGTSDEPHGNGNANGKDKDKPKAKKSRRR